MFERFTDEARQVVVLAQEEARSLRHNHIGTEHLLLGLLREKQGMAAQALESLSVGYGEAQAQVVELVGEGSETISPGHIPFTPRAKKVLELSMRESLSLGQTFIDTQHILLGLLGDEQGVGSRVLSDLGAGEERVRQQVVERLLGGTPARTADPPKAGRVPAGSAAHQGVWPARFWSSLNQVGFEVKRDLRRAPDSGDLLLLLSCLPDSVAERALARLHVEDGALDQAISDARDERRARAPDPEIEHVLRTVRKRREKASEDGDTNTAAALSQVERILDRIGRESEDGLGWTNLIHRVRQRLGLNGAEPGSEAQSPPGG